MDEEDARLALLQTEINNLQQTIRNMDGVILQIQGWCVTASLAIGGFAVTSRKPALLVVGEGAVAGFFLLHCQFKMLQRRFHTRNVEIGSELKKVGIMEVLKGAGTLEIVGVATWGRDYGSGKSIADRVRRNLPYYWHEVSRVSAFSLYMFLACCLFIEFLILL